MSLKKLLVLILALSFNLNLQAVRADGGGSFVSCFSWRQADGRCTWVDYSSFGIGWKLVCLVRDEAPSEMHCAEGVGLNHFPGCYDACPNQEGGEPCTCAIGSTYHSAGAHCGEDNTCEYN